MRTNSPLGLLVVEYELPRTAQEVKPFIEARRREAIEKKKAADAAHAQLMREVEEQGRLIASYPRDRAPRSGRPAPRVAPKQPAAGPRLVPSPAAAAPASSAKHEDIPTTEVYRALNRNHFARAGFRDTEAPKPIAAARGARPTSASLQALAYGEHDGWDNQLGLNNRVMVSSSRGGAA